MQPALLRRPDMLPSPGSGLQCVPVWLRPRAYVHMYAAYKVNMIEGAVHMRTRTCACTCTRLTR